MATTRHLNFKNLQGQGEHGLLATGIDGHGLFAAANGVRIAWTELLAPNRFQAHPGLSAEQVAHRLAACLVSIGWGPKAHNDRDTITDGGSVTATAVTTELLGPVEV